MKRAWLLALLPLAVACAHHHNPARVLNHRVDLWTDKTSTWAFDHCVLMGTVLDIGSEGHVLSPVSGGNYTLYAEKSFLFACPEMPPWPRHDSKGVREDWAVTPREIACQFRPEIISSNVTSQGNGKGVSSGSIVRVRLNRIDSNRGSVRLFHGRVPKNENETAAASPVQSPAPAAPAPFVTTGHVACLGCSGAAMLKEHLREGAQGTASCKSDGTWEYEVLAVGGEDLFERDLHLPASDDD